MQSSTRDGYRSIHDFDATVSVNWIEGDGDEANTAGAAGSRLDGNDLFKG